MTERPLQIALVGFGLLPIPPTGWGAVESILWEMHERLTARGHTVHIVNERKRKAFRALMNLPKLDFIHCHNDRAVSRVMAAGILKRARVIATSHHAWHWGALPNDSRRLLRMTSYAPFQLPLTDRCGHEIRRKNPFAKIAVQPNGCEVSQFRFQPSGNCRAICVGRIESRKRQDWIVRALAESKVECDFVGPIRDALLPDGRNYLGEWTREQLRERLTEYSALVLVSTAEGQPLVVPEALAAGLSVVVTRPAAENLDLSKPFVHLVEQEGDLQPTIERAIQGQDTLRQDARKYAEGTFDWEILMDRYERQLQLWRSGRGSSS